MFSFQGSRSIKYLLAEPYRLSPAPPVLTPETSLTTEVSTSSSPSSNASNDMTEMELPMFCAVPGCGEGYYNSIKPCLCELCIECFNSSRANESCILCGD